MTDSTNMYMPVAPAYGGGNGGFGFGDGNGSAWWLLILLIALGGWGNNGWGGNGGNGGMYPWLMNGQMQGYSDVQRGFDQNAVITGITGVQNAVTTGFGNVQTALCNGFGNVQTALCSGFAGVNAGITGAQNAIAQQLYGNEIASLNRSFAEQTANTAGFTGTQAGIADLKYTVATENCADRTASAQNTRDIIDAQTRGTQAILDKLCALELDGVKNQLAQAQRDNVGLQNQLNMANLAASQAAQTENIRSEIIGELRSCPIPAQPVYGSQPIFTCGGSNPVGCGCGGFAA